MAIETCKTIISGQLEFGSERSFSKVVKLFEHRVENYYRNDVVLKLEEVFDEGSCSLNVPRLITQTTEKCWRNTINLIEYLAGYATAGNLQAWRMADGKMLSKCYVEPQSDKAAVQAFLEGRELVKVEGMESEAKKALSRAIEKFERHATAYERRGRVNFLLKNYDDAMYDYSKSISINANNAEPYLGRATVKFVKGDLEGAILDLEQAIKKSIPHQPIFWKARRMKGECHLLLEEYTKAAFELKLFTKRDFPDDNPNARWCWKAFSQYGKALVMLQEYEESLPVIDKALELAKEAGKPIAEPLLNRGIARQKIGQDNFTTDWEVAASLGSKQAAQLLEEYA